MKKKFLIGFFWLFSLYPPVELTRVILIWVSEYGYSKDFLVEIPFIWIGYALMMTLFNLVLWTKWED